MLAAQSKSKSGTGHSATPESSGGASDRGLSSAQAQRTPAYALGQDDTPALPLFGGVVQAKLAVSQPGDPDEREADAVAQRVMEGTAQPAASVSTSGGDGEGVRPSTPGGAARAPSTAVSRKELEEDGAPGEPVHVGAARAVAVQRKCETCGGELAQPKCEECEGEVRRKAEGGASGGNGLPARGATESSIVRGGGQPLPAPARNFYESRFGHDFSQVRVHTGARAERSAKELGARAYTVGRDVVFGAGEFEPATRGGGLLLAHELAHVVQQGGGSRGEGAAQTIVRREPLPNQTPAGANQGDGASSAAGQAGAARPVMSGMSAALTGLFFQPPPGTTFAPGSKARQGIAIMLRRLVAGQYYEGLEDAAQAFLETLRQFNPQGALVGEATGGEPMTTLFLAPEIALALIGWLSQERGLEVAISRQQRELLSYGVFTSRAWVDISSQNVADAVGIHLPAWYSEELFRQEMTRNIELLRLYIEAAVRWDTSHQNRAELLYILQRILLQVNVGAQVLEAIRADTALAGHEAYRALWPPPRAAADAQPAPAAGQQPAAAQPAPPPTPAAPDQAPDLRVAALFVSFVTSQRVLAQRAIENHADRAELLERFTRFVVRAAALISTGGDQHVSDRPGGANTPPIPARLSSYPQLQPPLFDAALETDHAFTMQLQFADVFEAFMNFGYLWEMARVPDDQIGRSGDVQQLDYGDAPGMGAVASMRFRRASRYTVADVNRVIDDLGPAGLNALTLVAANSILRYIGTAIRLGFEILTIPASEKHIVFPGEGLYIVRCKAVPVTGDEAELVREPSVAYLPVLAREPEAMAETLTTQDVTSREAQLRRVTELQTILAEPVTHIDQEALEEELRRLTVALGPLEGLFDEQIRTLRQRRDQLPQGSQERHLVEQQLSNLTDIYALRTTRAATHGTAGSEMLAANFVADLGQTVRLTMEVVPQPNAGNLVQYWVSDLTTPNSSQATGVGANKSEAVLAAVREILEGIHGYGRGYASVNVEGQTHNLRIEASTGSLLMEALENTATALSLAAVIAAPFTEGASLALLMPIGAVSAIPSAYRLISRFADDTLRLDLASAMDVVNIVGGAIGLAEAITPLRMVNVGRGLMIAGLGVGGVGILLMGAQVLEQIHELEGLPEGLRAARLMEIIGQAMLNAGIMVGAALAERARAREMEEHVAQSDRTTGEPGGHTTEEPGPGGRPSAARDLQQGLFGEPRSTGQGGHEVKVTRRGQIYICSWPCELLSSRYGPELDANPGLRTQLEAINGRLEAATAANDFTAFDAAFTDAMNVEAQLRAARQPTIGWDNDQGRVIPHQAVAQEHLENLLGRRLDPLDPANPTHARKSGDWVDSAGRSYDAVGPFPEAHFNFDSFSWQIYHHLAEKLNCDFVFVDMSGLSTAQRALMRSYLRGEMPGGGRPARSGRLAGAASVPLTPEMRRRIISFP